MKINFFNETSFLSGHLKLIPIYSVVWWLSKQLEVCSCRTLSESFIDMYYCLFYLKDVAMLLQ